MTRRAPLKLSSEERSFLDSLSRSRTASVREVERAGILIQYADGIDLSAIAKDVGVTRTTVYKCIDKALAAGMQAGLKDTYHRSREPVITPEAAAWVVNLACTKPKDHGLAAELWTISALAGFVRKHAESAGHLSLLKAAKATVWRILNAQDIKPHRVTYYLERRDADFDAKMHDVLVVYEEVTLELESEEKTGKVNSRPIYTVSVDEKPGVQALSNTAPDLPPVPGKYSSVARDHEYVRHGTVSILGGIDLHDGHIFSQIHDRHRSQEFILLLKELDAHYPENAIIRVVLDNHSSHISKETMKYLESRPGRFQYVHTPKHGSWLNIIESVFSKMARSFLRHIRVASIDELKERIALGIAEMNALPIVFRWGKQPVA